MIIAMIKNLFKFSRNQNPMLLRTMEILSALVESIPQGEYKIRLINQLQNIRSIVSSDDYGIIKIQYGNKRNEIQHRFHLDFGASESIVGSIEFLNGIHITNFAQVYQIDGLISSIEYRNRPATEFNAKGNIGASVFYGLDRTLIIDQRDKIMEMIQCKKSELEINLTTVNCKAVAESGIKFAEFPKDFFLLCEICDNFSVSNWRFLGLNFRQVSISRNYSMDYFILAENSEHYAILLEIDKKTKICEIFLGKMVVDEIDLKILSSLGNSFIAAFRYVIIKNSWDVK
jgi:hypothetical protein